MFIQFFYLNLGFIFLLLISTFLNYRVHRQLNLFKNNYAVYV